MADASSLSTKSHGVPWSVFAGAPFVLVLAYRCFLSSYSSGSWVTIYVYESFDVDTNGDGSHFERRNHPLCRKYEMREKPKHGGSPAYYGLPGCFHFVEPRRASAEWKIADAFGLCG